MIPSENTALGNDAPTMTGRGGAKPSLLTLPNVLTFGRFALTFIVAYGVLRNDFPWLLVALGCAIVAMLSDLFDGYYARKHGSGSDLGKILDPMADAFFFVLTFVALAKVGAYPWWLALPFMLRELVQHLYVRPAALKRGLVMGAKFIGKFKTTCQCVAVLLAIVVRILQLFGRELAPYVAVDDLFAVLDWSVWIAVGFTALVSAWSLIPYLRHLQALKARL